MGPQPPRLKIASGTLLKMLTLQLTFGKSWQAIKPKLKIGAAGRGVVTRQQGLGLAGAEGDRRWLSLCFESGPEQPGWGSCSLLEGLRDTESKDKEDNG